MRSPVGTTHPKIRRRHKERGIIAVIGAWALFFVVALGLAITELGLHIVHSAEAHNAAESVAMTGGLVVLSQATPSWNMSTVPSADLVAGNSRSTENFQAFTFAPTQDINNGPQTPQVAPGIVNSMVQGPLSNLSPVLHQPASVGGLASSAVYQYQIAQLVPVYSRIVMVLDYSRSMRLYFSGYNVQTGSGLTVLRQAVNLAINDPGLNKPARVNWGLVEFAGAPDPRPVIPIYTSPTRNYLTQGDLDQQRANMQAHLAYPTASGMTDMASAVKYAADILHAQDLQSTNNPYLGKGVILIVSDGEPDWDPKNPSDDPSTYKTRVQNAEDNTIAEINKAWAYGYATVGLGIMTDPDPAEITVASLQDFMGKISGNIDGKGKPDASASAVAYKPSDVSTFLNRINPITHCLSRTAMDLSSNHWMNYPGTADNIYGYYVPGGQPRYQELAVKRAADPNNMDPVMQANGSWTNNQPQFWWDSKNRLAELNVTACAQYLSQQNMNPPPVFRLRWGVPRIYYTQKM